MKIFMNPLKWTPNDVIKQMNQNGLGKYSNSFLENQISGKDLLQLNEINLKDLGFTTVHRSVFFTWINTLHAPSIKKSIGLIKNIKKINIIDIKNFNSTSSSIKNNKINNNKVYTFGKNNVDFDIKELSFTPPPKMFKIPERLNKLKKKSFNIMESGSIDNRVPCKSCGRFFSSDRVLIHEKICYKASHSRRKVFNSQFQRTKGTELSLFIKKNNFLKEKKKN